MASGPTDTLPLNSDVDPPTVAVAVRSGADGDTPWNGDFKPKAAGGVAALDRTR